MDNGIFDSFGFLLVRVVRAHRGMIRHKMHELGLHRGQPHVMFALQKHEGMSNSEMAEFMEITPATLTNMVKRMEKAGLVVRRRDPDDERVSRIYMTDKGRGLMGELRVSMLEMEDVLLDGFSETEVQDLKSHIHKVLENIEEEECQHE